MRRMILGFAAAVLATFAASDASACLHKKACATPCAAPAPVVCEPVVCAPKKKCFSMPKIKLPKLGCHKKAVCAPVATCAPCGEVAYAAPQATWAAPQVAPTMQSLPVPQK